MVFEESINNALPFSLILPPFSIIEFKAIVYGGTLLAIIAL